MIDKGIETQLAGLVDNETQLFLSPFIARSGNLSHAGTYPIRGYTKSNKNFSNIGSFTDFLGTKFDFFDFEFDAFSDVLSISGLSDIEKGTDNSDVTFEMIINFTTLPVGIYGIFGCLDGLTGVFCAMENPGFLRFGYRNGGANVIRIIGSAVTTNMFHIAITYNNTTGNIDIYRNGVLSNGTLTGTPSGGLIPSTDANFWLGKIGTSVGGYNLDFAEIGEFRISSKIRSVAEMKSFCNNSWLARYNNFSI